MASYRGDGLIRRLRRSSICNKREEEGNKSMRSAAAAWLGVWRMCAFLGSDACFVEEAKRMDQDDRQIRSYEREKKDRG